MKILWCWRCRREIGMLNDEEFKIASKLYGDCLRNVNNNAPDLESRMKPLLDYYNSITGEEVRNPNAIMHHQISQYGPPCEHCGKPYRTPRASFCAACGNKRASTSP